MSDTVEVKKMLFDRLREYYDDKDFVSGVISNTKNDDDRKTILDYMDNGEDVTVENIILLSLQSEIKERDAQDEG